MKGCTTNTMFLRQILAYKPFVDGTYDTGIIPKYFKKSPVWYREEHKVVALIAAAIFNFEKEKKLLSQISVASKDKNTLNPSRWRSQSAHRQF